MQRRFLFLSCLCAFLFLTGCDKNDIDPVDPMVSLLTRAPWKFSKMEADGNDVSSAVSACAQDNTITFHASMNGEVNESTNVCSPSYAKNFLWDLKENNSKLNVSSAIFPGGPPEFTIVSASETTLVLRQGTTLIPGPSEVIVTITLVH